jgi:ribosomal protein S18 acetylase RimI-like enzyme
VQKGLYKIQKKIEENGNEMNSVIIRNFQQTDMPLLGDFYQKVTKNRKVVFWWIGPEENWENVFCAFDDNQMIAKGQVEVINSVPESHPADSKHTIFLNLKALPGRESDFDLLNSLYDRLHDRALTIKEELSSSHQTIFCVGNFSSEVNNNRYFLEEKNFKPHNTLYTMKRDLHQPVQDVALAHGNLKWDFWKMETLEEEKEYLAVECEIWPDVALGERRLHEYKGNEDWTAISVRQNGNIIACTMAWKDEEIGVIEDVFVREAWRKQGIARFLLTKALLYLKGKGLGEAHLMVDTENEKALNLYKSVGFEVVEEEKRYFVELV